MIPLKRCKAKEGAKVLPIDVEVDDDDVIVVDMPGCLHPKKGESSEQRENQRVSPQSVIRIDDDDDNKSDTNHVSSNGEEDFAEFESDATSSHRSSSIYGVPHDARSQHYQFDHDEYEPIDIDSDCEVMEDSSGELREQWEKAASQRKLNRHKANVGSEDLGAASPWNTITSDVRKRNMTEPFSEGPSCSKANAPFDAEIPSTFNVANEENHVPSDQDTLFPEFDWRNLDAHSSFKKHISSDIGDGFTDNSSRLFHGFISENFPSQHDIGGTSFGLNGRDQKEQCCADSRDAEGRVRGKVISESQYANDTNISQALFSAGHVRNASHSHCENCTTEIVDCHCVFLVDCDCGRSRKFVVEKVNMEEQKSSVTPCEMKSNQNEAGFDSRSGDLHNNIPVNMDREAVCEKNVSKGTDEELEKLSSSEKEVRQDSFLQSKGLSAESNPNYVQEGGSSDTPGVEESYGIDIINDKERLKETAEYKRALEEESVLRQQQLKFQAEEAQKLKKRKKAEQLRVSNMEKRQKLRVEEVRESQKQDSANLNIKEQLRSEVTKELKVLEMRCFDMATVLRSLGVPVDGGAHPSQQQIHGAYKRALLKFHPDRTSGSSLKKQVDAEEKFKLISRMKEKYKLR